MGAKRIKNICNKMKIKWYWFWSFFRLIYNVEIKGNIKFS